MEGSRKRRRSECDEAACFRYATDFAGMDMVSFALRTWADLFTMIHVFASECNSVARRVLLANHRPRRVFHDVAQRNASDPEFRDLDLYAAGAPCQPWASGGQHLGLLDPRASLLDHAISFIEQARPRRFLLENSALLRTTGRGRVFARLANRLRAAGYILEIFKANTADWGLPHFRTRLYVIGGRLDFVAEAYCRPTPLPDGLPWRLSLTDILAPRQLEDSPANLPPAPTAAQLVFRARQRTGDIPEGADWVVNQFQSVRFANGGRPRRLSPCLVHGMTRGYWVGSRGRELSLPEACRLQGLCAHQIHWVCTPPQAFGLLGNSMSLCVLERLLATFMGERGRVMGPDRWLAGTAQQSLMEEARGRTRGAGARVAGRRRQTSLLSFVTRSARRSVAGRASSPPAEEPSASSSVMRRTPAADVGAGPD